MNTSSKLKIEGSADDILKFAHGGKPRPALAQAGNRPMQSFQQGGQPLAQGGMAQGPSHEQGGIAAVQSQTGEQVAEIEGGERVFSQEDTAALEQAALQIIELSESGDKQKANDMAMRLGYAVVNMIAAQEQNQSAQEEQMAGQAGQDEAAMEAEAMNQFATEPEM